MQKLLYTVFATVLAGGVMVGTAGAASAAHCLEGDSPGFSYFGTDHVQKADHAEGNNPGHMGTPGASNCRDTTGSPSERAPGRG